MRAAIIVPVAALVAGALVWGGRSGWHAPLVTVRAKNAGATAITSMRLMHGATTGEYGPLAAGENRTLRYVALGKSRYHLEVTLADGRTLSTRSGPVQPGWTITEAVSGRAIHPTYSAAGRAWQRPAWLGGGDR